jgi:Peptidase family M50
MGQETYCGDGKQMNTERSAEQGAERRTSGRRTPDRRMTVGSVIDRQVVADAVNPVDTANAQRSQTDRLIDLTVFGDDLTDQVATTGETTATTTATTPTAELAHQTGTFEDLLAPAPAVAPTKVHPLVTLAGVAAIAWWTISSHALVTLGVVAALAGMIFLHELGHFLAAKATGTKATEFFVGFGPRIWSFRRGETEYGIKAIPLGGYVKIIGMTNLEEVDPADEHRSYRQKSYPRRVLMASAGTGMHLLLAFALLMFTYVVLFARPSSAACNRGHKPRLQGFVPMTESLLSMAKPLVTGRRWSSEFVLSGRSPRHWTLSVAVFVRALWLRQRWLMVKCSWVLPRLTMRRHSAILFLVEPSVHLIASVNCFRERLLR